MSDKIGVLGLWHLGCVTSACLATHYQVIGLDFDADLIEKLNEGRAPIFEPGLDDLLKERLAAGQLSFAVPTAGQMAEFDVLWVTYDTPVDEDDRSDVSFVLDHLHRVAVDLKRECLVVISSQLPVGSCRQFERAWAAKAISVACVPENLRLGQAIEIFTKPDRILAGVRDTKVQNQLEPILAKFSQRMIWMSPESAEMSKHAINSFLALSITFMNEVARLCERTGADAREVSEGLRSESRIGPKAYLSPGAAFAGGTLARDVVSLTGIAAEKGERIDVIPAIYESNEQHRLWAWRKLSQLFPSLKGRKIVLFGLTYKPQTDTLRRSSALELARRLVEAGAHITAWDPAVRSLPQPLLSQIHLAGSAQEAARESEALVLCTPWPEFREEDWKSMVASMKTPLVLDAGRFLARQVADLPQISYHAVGAPDHA